MKRIELLVVGIIILLCSCEKNELLRLEQSRQTLTGHDEALHGGNRMKAKLVLDIDGLEPLGSAAKYEGWIIVDGIPVTTGLFQVTPNGQLAPSQFNVNASDLAAASMFVLTIEPNPDPNPAPSATHILAGMFSGNSASLSVDHPAAIGDDFSSAAGKFLLATPTTASMTDEDKGVWFIDNSSGSGMPGLNLPVLPSGWKFEGWAVINGKPVTTGTFTAVNTADDSAPFSGPLPGPPFPGEDFIKNAPRGLRFPPNLSGAPIVITIEPYPDNSPAPFFLKPVIGSVPMNPNVHTTFSLSNNASTFPTGTAKR